VWLWSSVDVSCVALMRVDLPSMNVDGYSRDPSTSVNGSVSLAQMAVETELPERERGVCCALPKRLRPERVELLADTLKALADPTRVEIVAILRAAEQPVCICDLDAAFDLSQPTLSHHMAKLRDAGLVEVEKRGIYAFYRLRRDLPPAARRLVDAIG